MNDSNTIPPAPQAAPYPLALALVLMAAAGVELVDGAMSLPILAGDMSEIPGPGFGGFLIKAYIASHAPLALIALGFAAFGKLRVAIVAMAAIVVMNWLNYMPSVVLHGFDFDGLAALQTPIQIIGYPLMAVCGMALAQRNERLRLATALVTIPTVFGALSVVAFAIGVSIYGF